MQGNDAALASGDLQRRHAVATTGETGAKPHWTLNEREKRLLAAVLVAFKADLLQRCEQEAGGEKLDDAALQQRAAEVVETAAANHYRALHDVVALVKKYGEEVWNLAEEWESKESADRGPGGQGRK